MQVYGRQPPVDVPNAVAVTTIRTHQGNSAIRGVSFRRVSTLPFLQSSSDHAFKHVGSASLQKLIFLGRSSRQYPGSLCERPARTVLTCRVQKLFRDCPGTAVGADVNFYIYLHSCTGRLGGSCGYTPYATERTLPVGLPAFIQPAEHSKPSG